jgi:hypothetical protein
MTAWIMFIVSVLEVLLRVIPTKFNWTPSHNIVQLLIGIRNLIDIIIPNIKKDV